MDKTNLTIDDIRSVIAGEDYQCFDNKLTICVLTLVNGYKVTGQSSVVDPKNFDAATGRKIALEQAINKVWELEGYLLQQHLWAVNQRKFFEEELKRGFDGEWKRE